MKLLLDTHALVWWTNKSDQLSRAARAAMLDDEMHIVVSSVSAFEIALKHRLGKLPEAQALIDRFHELVAADGFHLLPVSVDHALLAGALPIAHKDPFDRLLIAQAQIEQAVLVSNATLFDSFAVRRLW